MLLLGVGLGALKEVKDTNKWRLLEVLWSCCSYTWIHILVLPNVGGRGKSCGIAVRVRHVLSTYTFKMLFHYVAEFFVLSSGTEMDGVFFFVWFSTGVDFISTSYIRKRTSSSLHSLYVFCCWLFECFSTCENCIDSISCLIRSGDLFLYWRCYRQAAFVLFCLLFSCFLRWVPILEY